MEAEEEEEDDDEDVEAEEQELDDVESTSKVGFSIIMEPLSHVSRVSESTSGLFKSALSGP